SGSASSAPIQSDITGNGERVATRGGGSMNHRAFVAGLVAVVVVASWQSTASAGSPEVEELKRQVRMLQNRIEELERREEARPPAAVAPAPHAGAPARAAAPPPAEVVGHQGPVEDRGSFRDEQQAAPRPGDFTLDPKYRGFAPIPNTDVMIKFNAKPRTDF